jgi:putative zinc finger/helix-turn-helix YgiT family protein
MNHTTLHSTSLHICPACASSDVATRWEGDHFTYGTGKEAVELTVRIPVRNCATCGLEYLDKEAERIRHERVCLHLKILSPSQIVANRERHGISQQKFADLTRIGRASLTRWETGALYQNPANDSLLFLTCFPDNLTRLQQRRMPESVIENEDESSKFRALTPFKQQTASREAESFILFATH